MHKLTLPSLAGRPLVASLLMAPLMLGGAQSLARADSLPIAPSATQQISLTGREFGFSQSVVLLPLGQQVQFTVSNTGLLDHDIKSNIPVGSLTYIHADNDPAEQKENAANGTFDVDFNKGTTAQVTFVANQPGAYEFHCDVPGHTAAGMKGTFVVLPSDAVALYQAHNGQLLLRNTAGQVYALSGGKAVAVPDLATFASQGYTWDMVAQVPDSIIASLPAGTLLPQALAASSLHDGDLIKGSTDSIYVVQGGQKQAIPDLATFTKLGFTWGQVKVVFDSVLDALPTGPARQS